MKKIILTLSLLCLLFTISQAQLTPVIKKPAGLKITRTQPEQPKAPPPPAPINKSTSNPDPVTPTYRLTSARVSIRTGSDNKEFPSKVYVSLRPKSTREGDYHPFTQKKLDNEMRINSDTEFGLEHQPLGDAKLESFINSGLHLGVRYVPNFFADAWKIENISVTLEFKDQNGNLHPTLGRKTIVFSNAYGFLNNEYVIMECEADGNFMPLYAVIKK